MIFGSVVDCKNRLVRSLFVPNQVLQVEKTSKR